MLLVTVDGVRPDRIRTGGPAAGTAPRLEALAAAGVSFDHALTPLPRRRPALATLLTGLAPVKHQLRFDEHVLFPEHESLAERLQAEGWSTAAFVSDAALLDEAGLGQGFELREGFDDDGPEALVERAWGWLATANRTADRFVWVHFADPTAPYLPPGGHPADGFSFFEVDARGRPVHPENAALHEHARALVTFGKKRLPPEEVARAVALKDAEVAAFDARLGELIDAAGAGACVVVAGTHGESLGEHDSWFDHGEFLYDTSLRVPLILRAGGLPAARVETSVGLADVVPTLLEHLGLPPIPAATGRSLVGAWRDGALDPRPLFAESGPPVAWPEHPRFRALSVGAMPARARARAMADPALRLRAVSMPSGRKFILDPIDGRLLAFDLRSDPGETNDRAADPTWAQDVARARETLEVIVALDRGRVLVGQGHEPPPLPPLDRTVVQQLIEAGYLGE